MACLSAIYGYEMFFSRGVVLNFDMVVVGPLQISPVLITYAFIVLVLNETVQVQQAW